jgi:RNA polymerase sigma factor (sigma-70 family)
MKTDDNMRTRGTLLQRIADVENAHAWYEFVYYYRGYIYGVLKKLEVQHHDAEEIIQHVLLKILNSIKAFEYDPQVGRFRSYLARITLNAARNHFRSQRHDVSLSEEQLPQGVIEESIADSEIDRIAEDEWIEHLYRIAWRNVSVSFGDTVKQAWEMLADGRSPEDIARELGISKGNVYVYKKRVLQKLEPELKRLKADLE